MIEIKNLSVSFSGKIILEKINFSITPGENTIIIGKSGCGKSVLMKTIEGLINPDQGQVLINGYDIHQVNRKQLSKIRRKMAMLFQGSALLDSLTVYQNIALPLFEHSGKSEEDVFAIVSEMLDLVGLQGVYDNMPSELSGGMKKRVALARAVVLKPDYIIFDEPTTGLDPVITGEIVKLIIKLQEKYNLTSIIITHDLECLRQISARVIMIADKHIIFDGPYKNFMQEERKEIVKFRGINKG